jgi:biofilm PGA synthesis N-glycosyltransferase PgaC
MEIFAAVLIAGYGALMLSLCYGWLRLASLSRTAIEGSSTFSIVVAARNEESSIPNLLQSLANQSYPQKLWEVIVVDDDSTDRTLDVLHKAQQQYSWLRVINNATSGKHGKKAALQAAIESSQNDIICTTDADCILPSDWLKPFAEAFQNQSIQLVSGPVAYDASGGILEKLQTVEFAGLIGAGAGCISLGQPTMCNGANLAFRKPAFYAVQGYAGNENVASGDDEFLLHKIADRYGKLGYTFLKQDRATVKTSPKKSAAALFEQRMRWASKWPHYQRQSPQVLALFIGGIYVLMFVLMVTAVTGVISLKYAALLLLLKTGIDLFFFAPILRFFRLGHLWWAVLLLQLVYPPFVIALGLSGFRKQYQWKSRTFPS